jgi:predicted nuclease with TOPRIM domain
MSSGGATGHDPAKKKKNKKRAARGSTHGATYLGKIWTADEKTAMFQRRIADLEKEKAQLRQELDKANAQLAKARRRIKVLEDDALERAKPKPRGSEMTSEQATKRPQGSEGYQAHQLHNTRAPGSPMYDY